MYNGHGDVVNLTDGGNSIIATYYYDAFGVHKTQNGGGDNPYRYSGYTFDQETGLYYLKARFYDPLTSRMLSEDSYKGNSYDPLSLNLYTYCRNNPIQYYDPSGYSDVAVRNYYQDQGYGVGWTASDPGKGNAVITITDPKNKNSTPLILKEGVDFYVGKDGKSYFINNSSNGVRTSNEPNLVVDWKAGSNSGNSTIELSTNNGTPIATLKEGKEYYIGNDGKAYYLTLVCQRRLPTMCRRKHNRRP